MAMFTDMDPKRTAEDRTSAARGVDLGVQALYTAATRLADVRRGAPRFKTRDLVGLLLTHGARSWRNSQPRTNVRVRAFSPAGRSAVRLYLG